MHTPRAPFSQQAVLTGRDTQREPSLKMPREHESDLTRCESVSPQLLAVVLILGTRKISCNANSTAAAVFSSSVSLDITTINRAPKKSK